jgi:hypothetical protein
VPRRDLADVNGRRDAERHSDDQRDDRNHQRSDEERHDPIPILPETRGDPFLAEQE